MAEYLIQDSTLTEICDAIREKLNLEDLIPITMIPYAISLIETGDSTGAGNTTSYSNITIVNSTSSDISFGGIVVEPASECLIPVKIDVVSNKYFMTLCGAVGSDVMDSLTYKLVLSDGSNVSISNMAVSTYQYSVSGFTLTATPIFIQINNSNNLFNGAVLTIGNK